MKDKRFIELVNLYVDRQISPGETAELEAELQASPRRRQVYQQYCRMHRATQLVYESFRKDAGRDAPQPAARGGSLVRLESARRRRSRWAYALGGMAAAACVGLFLSRTFLPADAVIGPVANQPVASLTVAAAPQVPPRVPVNLLADQSQASLVSLRNPLALEAGYPGMLSALQLAEAERALVGVPRERSLFDDDVFSLKPLLPEQNPRTYRNRRGAPNQPASEFSAFQFQR